MSDEVIRCECIGIEMDGDRTIRTLRVTCPSSDCDIPIGITGGTLQESFYSVSSGDWSSGIRSGTGSSRTRGCGPGTCLWEAISLGTQIQKYRLILRSDLHISLYLTRTSTPSNIEITKGISIVRERYVPFIINAELCL